MCKICLQGLLLIKLKKITFNLSKILHHLIHEKKHLLNDILHRKNPKDIIVII